MRGGCEPVSASAPGARLARIVAGLFVVWLVAGCNIFEHVARLRLTVEIDDNGRIVRGSAVQEEHCRFNTGIALGLSNGIAVNCGLKGEALVVDLGAKGQAFVLLEGLTPNGLTGPSAWSLFQWENRKLLDPDGLSGAAFERIAAQGQPVEITEAEKLPTMVRFATLRDPTSVERVDPEHMDDAFGPGVRFVKATVQVTDDSVTEGIEKWLPWLDQIDGNALSGLANGRIVTFADSLTRMNFTKNMK